MNVDPAIPGAHGVPDERLEKRMRGRNGGMNREERFSEIPRRVVAFRRIA
jgi:hypothetical protein